MSKIFLRNNSVTYEKGVYTLDEFIRLTEDVDITNQLSVYREYLSFCKITNKPNNMIFCLSNNNIILNSVLNTFNEKKLVIPNIVSVMDKACLSGLSSLESVTIGESVKDIKEFCLANCQNLKVIKISKSLLRFKSVLCEQNNAIIKIKEL